MTHSDDITLFMRKWPCKDLPDTVWPDGNSWTVVHVPDMEMCCPVLPPGWTFYSAARSRQPSAISSCRLRFSCREPPCLRLNPSLHTLTCTFHPMMGWLRLCQACSATRLFSALSCFPILFLSQALSCNKYLRIECPSHLRVWFQRTPHARSVTRNNQRKQS